MTQKAPERISLMDDELPDFEDTYPVGGSTEYIRADHALALVAAAYEDAARHHDYYAYSYIPSPEDRAAHQGHARRIRARNDADAQAALERVKRKARNEALREAAETAEGFDVEVRDAILALITEDQSDE